MKKTIKQLELEIEQLKEALAWYVKEDDTHEWDANNQYWIDGKRRAQKLLGIDIEETTE
jgi:hypothetical protein